MKSGTASERRKRSVRAEGLSGGRVREGGYSGDLPRENFTFKRSVQAILLHFETIFAVKFGLLLLHVKRVSNPTTKE